MAEYKQMTYKIGKCTFDDAFYEKKNNILEVEIHANNVSELNFKLSDIKIDSKIQIWLKTSIESEVIDCLGYNYISIEVIGNTPLIFIDLFQYLEDSYKNWNLKCDMKTFYNLVKNEINKSHEFAIYKDNSDEDSVYYNLSLNPQNDTYINELYLQTTTSLDEIFKIVKLETEGIAWKEIYFSDEKKFSRDVVEPVLRKLNFTSVVYNHGKKEYGKDFICSYNDNFYIKRYIGIQVKAGNLSGKVNSQIDEILGQIEDAFSMPFMEVGDKSEKFISFFFVVISGYFTENAKEKINEKIPKNLIGNISFIDRDGINSLADNIENKKITMPNKL